MAVSKTWSFRRNSIGRSGIIARLELVSRMLVSNLVLDTGRQVGPLRLVLVGGSQDKSIDGVGSCELYRGRYNVEQKLGSEQ